MIDLIKKHERFTANFSTVHSLFRVPLVTHKDNIPGDTDVAVIGVPFDLATTGRSGTRGGPQSIRLASGQLTGIPECHKHRINPFKKIKIIDTGDCKFDNSFPLEIPDVITYNIELLLQKAKTTLSLGGDHFITYPILRAYAKKYGPMSIIHFDAHSDTWDDVEGSLNHGTMFTRAVEENIIDPKRSVQIGLRTFNDHTRGFNIITSEEVYETPLKDITKKVQDIVGNHPTYLTFDIDGVDPSYAPGTGTPVPGGMMPYHVLTLLQNFETVNWVGMDLVEVAPAYDHGDVTSLLASSVIKEYLCSFTRYHKK